MTERPTIDPELRDLLPPASKETDAELCENLKANGLEDPVFVWKEKNVVIDGHRRLTQCDRAKVGVKFRYKSFKNVSDVKIWMIERYFSQRHIADPEVVDKLTSLLRKKGKGKSEAVGMVANATGRSERQVYRDLAAQEAFKSLRPVIQEQVKGLSKEAIVKFASMTVPSQKAALNNAKGDIAKLGRIVNPPPAPSKVESTTRVDSPEPEVMEEAFDQALSDTVDTARDLVKEERGKFLDAVNKAINSLDVTRRAMYDVAQTCDVTDFESADRIVLSLRGKLVDWKKQ